MFRFACMRFGVGFDLPVMADFLLLSLSFFFRVAEMLCWVIALRFPKGKGGGLTLF